MPAYCTYHDRHFISPEGCIECHREHRTKTVRGQLVQLWITPITLGHVILAVLILAIFEKIWKAI